MEKYTRVLQRVEEDLARGHTHVAVQRLSTLVQADPTDLALRSRLAGVQLRAGNWVEAGRWGYLDRGRDPQATEAFERAFPHPRARWAALRWPALVPGQAPDDVGAVLEELQRQARDTPRPRGGAPLRLVTPREQVVGKASDLAFTVGLLLTLGVFLIGLVTVVRWAF